MNPEDFGDDFHELVVASCPLLERFTSCGVYMDDEPDRPMLESLTDRSLKTLSTLPRLEFLELNAKNITGDGVFDLVFKPPPQSTWAMREYRVLVGEGYPDTATRPSSPVVPFYSILLRLLEQLAAADDSTAISSRPVVLWFVNNSGKTAGEAWYGEYLGQVSTLVTQITTKYPRMLMEIGLVENSRDWDHVGDDFDGDWSYQISSFGLCTYRTDMPDWQKGSFLNRQGEYESEWIDMVFRRYYPRTPPEYAYGWD